MTTASLWAPLRTLRARALQLSLLCLASLAPGWAAAQGGAVTVQWLGQSAMKITSLGGKVIVIDPWLTSNPKTPAEFKKLEALGKVDLILLTHAHFDHIADAPALSAMNKAPVYAPAGLADSFATLGVMPVEMAPRFNKGGVVFPLGPDAGIKIIATHAEHSSEFRWKNPETGKDEMRLGGEPMGYIVELENGFRIYHMGDTGIFGDMKLIGELYKPDLILIPIGSHFVMPPADAAYATRELLKPKFAIPMHYGTNALLRGTPKEYTDALGQSATKVLVLEPGAIARF
jgi:L-ascorbate metabolism protein UlaG (beta-lactamase superfamily)